MNLVTEIVIFLYLMDNETSNTLQKDLRTSSRTARTRRKWRKRTKKPDHTESRNQRPGGMCGAL